MQVIFKGLMLEAEVRETTSYICPYDLEVHIPRVGTRSISLTQHEFLELKRSQEAP